MTVIYFIQYIGYYIKRKYEIAVAWFLFFTPFFGWILLLLFSRGLDPNDWFPKDPISFKKYKELRKGGMT